MVVFSEKGNTLSGRILTGAVLVFHKLCTRKVLFNVVWIAIFCGAFCLTEMPFKVLLKWVGIIIIVIVSFAAVVVCIAFLVWLLMPPARLGGYSGTACLKPGEPPHTTGTLGHTTPTANDTLNECDFCPECGVGILKIELVATPNPRGRCVRRHALVCGNCRRNFSHP